jgi:membrane protease YdiL (CAAX protease family)
MSNTPSSLLRPFWQNLFPQPTILGIWLIFLWGIPRFIIVLLANQSGSYQWVSLIFVSMWFTPWIFLSRKGRRQIGLQKPIAIKWLLWAVGLGALACFIMFLLAHSLYEDSISNWFIYISRSYSNVPKDLTEADRLVYFLIFAVIGMIFSPIGEELLYRGIIHECFSMSWGDRKASFIDSAAFSLTHLAHFGIVYHLGKWSFLLIPSLIWVSLLFLTCQLFFWARKKSGSILGAIFAHAGFNVMMSYLIFYYLL